MMNGKNDIKTIIDSKLSELTVSSVLENKILKSCQNKKRTKKKPLLIAVVIVLCIMISVPVMASRTGLFNKLLYLINTQTAQILQPIELVSESNGIKMEIIAAMNDNETAVIYLGLKDMEGKDRVDKTVDLYNYTVEGANMFTHQLVDYNQDTNTAIIRMIANGGRKLNGRKISVNVNSFLSGKEYYKEVDTGIILKDIANRVTKTIPLNMDNISGSGGNIFEELDKKGIINVLKTDETKILLPNIDFVSISNIGYVDGRLHVQTKWTGSIDDHGFLYLTNSSGDRINPSNIYFGIDEEGNTKYGSEYIEYIFKVKPTQIFKYNLYGEFVKNNNYIEGDWHTTFRIESVNSSQKTTNNVTLGDVKINKLTVTPIGLNINGVRGEIDNLDIDIIMKDNTVINCNHSISRKSNGILNMKYMFIKPIAVENIKEIKINKKAISFK